MYQNLGIPLWGSEISNNNCIMYMYWLWGPLYIIRWSFWWPGPLWPLDWPGLGLTLFGSVSPTTVLHTYRSTIRNPLNLIMPPRMPAEKHKLHNKPGPYNRQLKKPEVPIKDAPLTSAQPIFSCSFAARGVASCPTNYIRFVLHSSSFIYCHAFWLESQIRHNMWHL